MKIYIAIYFLFIAGLSCSGQTFIRSNKYIDLRISDTSIYLNSNEDVIEVNLIMYVDTNFFNDRVHEVCFVNFYKFPKAAIIPFEVFQGSNLISGLSYIIETLEDSVYVSGNFKPFISYTNLSDEIQAAIIPSVDTVNKEFSFEKSTSNLAMLDEKKLIKLTSDMRQIELKVYPTLRDFHKQVGDGLYWFYLIYDFNLLGIDSSQISEIKDCDYVFAGKLFTKRVRLEIK